MKKNYIILLFAMLLSGVVFAQEAQKNFINYQGVARNAGNVLMSGEAIEISIALKFGSANASAIYQESHSITTDANGVFSLLIGNGSPVSGNYNTLPWGSVAAFITVSLNGNEVGTTEMMAVPYAISSGDADNQTAAEVPYDNALSGLTATNAQEAIDELVGSDDVDADADPSNELQTLIFDAGTNELTISDGNSVIIPSGGTDADADPTNELQTISFDALSNTIRLTDGGEITIPTGGTDADADPENEFQTLSFDPATNELSLSDGNTITIPSGGTDADADPENEIDVTRQHGLLVGDDGIVDGLVGTADGQVAKWDSALGNWVAGTDETSSGGSGTSTGLEALDQGNGNGWRLIGRNPVFHAPIGKNAVDLSFNDAGGSVGAAGENSFSSGRGTYAGGISATAMGKFSFAEGDFATALGEETTASGIRSTAMGSRSEASGSVSFAVGEETLASGEFAVAMGDRSRATEQSSTAFGSGTVASNTHATAMGNGTVASGTSATAAGVSTKAGSLASFALGRNNIGGGDPFVWQTNDPLFEIGNGTDAVANNALTVLKNGKVGIGTDTPVATLEVKGSINSSELSGTGTRNVSADADGNLVIGGGSGGSSLWSEDLEGINYSSGNIGIGTVSSQFYPLSIRTDSDRSIALSSSNPDNFITFSNPSSTGFTGYLGILSGDNDMDIGTSLFNPTGKVHLTIGSFPRLTVAPTGDVGIGIETPTSKLDVDGTVRSRGLSGGGNVVADADGNLIIGAGGSSLWSVSGSDIYYDSGKVGIGTNSPSSTFHVVSTNNMAMNLETETDGNYIRFTNADGYKGYAGVWTGLNDMDFGTGVGNLTGKVHLTTNATPKLTVIQNGNVGIGITSPTAKFDVDGDARVRGLGGSGQRNVMADADGNLVIGSGGTDGGAARIDDLEDARAMTSSVFLGINSGIANTGNNLNTGVGASTLRNNTTGRNNTAVGYAALSANTTAVGNTAIGNQVLTSNTTGWGNTATGYEVMVNNLTGLGNTANGSHALKANIAGTYNTALGYSTLSSAQSSDNTAIGAFALNDLIDGRNNIGIGLGANVPDANANDQVQIGNDRIAYAGIQVPWTITSDARWKDRIRELPYGLEMVNLLRPVDYVRKNNDKNTREIGFVAQEVEKVFSHLNYEDQGILTKDGEGFMSLRYNDFIPVLTMAIQEQQQIIENQSEKIFNLETRLQKLEAQIGN